MQGDYSYGPFIISRDLLAPIYGVDRSVGWGWRHFAFVAAHRSGRRLAHVRGDYVCPAGERTEHAGDRQHRLKQLSDNLRGLLT